MAAYTNTTRLAAYLGTDVVAAIVANPGIDLTVMIADASAFVGSLLRNSGYAPPDTTDPTQTGDLTINLATEAVVIRALSKVPEASLPLPEDWENSAQVMALKGLLSGDVTLALTVTNISAVGGSAFTNSDPMLPVSEGGRPQRASRKELASY